MTQAAPVGRKRRLSRALWRVTLWPRFAYYVRALVGLLVTAVALLLVVPVGCTPPGPATAPAASVGSPARVAYDAARLALAAIDTVEDQRLAELEHVGYSAKDLRAAEVRSQRLQLAHAALSAAHGHLVVGKVEDVRTALLDAVRIVRQLAADPAITVPAEALQALAMAEAWLGLGGAGDS
jgi:hypothetical protein